jgi:glycosyltransferase involved in cell wall biosynthesis
VSAVVTVVMPTFNRPEYLEATIAGVRAQSFSDWELVIVDDGSDTATRRILEAASTQDRTRVLWLDHAGNPARTRNAGIHAASSRYVAFIDSDDLWEPRKLERQLSQLAREPTCRWCYTAFTRVDAAGSVLAAEATRRWNAWRGDVLLGLIDGRATVRSPSVVLAERALLDETGGFDERLRSCEDYDLWMRLALLSPVALVDESLVRVRQNPGSWSSRAPGLFQDREASLARFAASAPPRAQSALRRARAWNSLTAASRVRAEIGPGAAVEQLTRSLAFAWPYPRWWLRGAWLVLRGAH